MRIKTIGKKQASNAAKLPHVGKAPRVPRETGSPEAKSHGAESRGAQARGAESRGAQAQPTPVSPAELERWIAKARSYPDIRWEKVQAMRAAIQAEGFDGDERLAQLADRLPDELLEYLRQTGQA